ncbi:peptidoglycan-binding domain-containing protein [Kribbella sp. NPDC051770]|uniref:peptidoglycan-binding domain-containing protein n=1 Tax=Kribbella sp. NPDC051770 TaxID=3155413 RepID=UPI00343D9095
MRNILRRRRTRGAVVAAALAGSLVCGLVATADADVSSPSPQSAPAETKAAQAVQVTAASCSTTYLAYGSRGECVRQLQTNLGGLSADGVYGAATRNRVRAFQTDARISADGKVGPQTWKKLRSYGKAMAWAGGITLYMCELNSKAFRVSAWNNTGKWADWAYYMYDHGYPLDGEKIGPNRLANQFNIYAERYEGKQFTAWVGSSVHHTRSIRSPSATALPAC